MMTATLDAPMATKRNDTTTKIDVDVLADARTAASYRRMSLAEYITEVVKVAADRDIEEYHALRSKQAKTKK